MLWEPILSHTWAWPAAATTAPLGRWQLNPQGQIAPTEKVLNLRKNAIWVFFIKTFLKPGPGVPRRVIRHEKKTFFFSPTTTWGKSANFYSSSSCANEQIIHLSEVPPIMRKWSKKQHTFPPLGLTSSNTFPSHETLILITLHLKTWTKKFIKTDPFVKVIPKSLLTSSHNLKIYIFK